jgi:hypothetical protein
MKRIALAGILTVICYLDASALTYSNWIAASESWKRGYVFSYVDYVMTYVSPEEKDSAAWAKGYRACLDNFSDQAMARIVDEYLVRNPSAKTQPMIVVVNWAIRELCIKHLPVR